MKKKKILKNDILIIGGGYVGFYTALKLLKNDDFQIIDILDISEQKYKNWKEKRNPINDSYLSIFLENNKQIFEKIRYQNEFKFEKYNYIFIALPTNPKKRKLILDTNPILEYVQKIRKINKTAKIIIRSTINLQDFNWMKKLELNYWPEFLSQGQKIEKNLNGHKIIFAKSENVEKEEIRKLISINNNIEFVKIEESIIIKIFHNSFDAFSITISNLLANIASENNLKFSNLITIINDLLEIKPRVKKPGLGYGGSCYPKDSRSLFTMTKSKNNMKLLKNLNEYNLKQQDTYKEYLKFINKSDLILILGISFKGQTNDITETPIKKLINYLLNKKYKFKIWEPGINNINLSKIDKNLKIENLSQNIGKDLEKCNLIFIGSDWNIFNEFIKSEKIKNKKIFDLKGSIMLHENNKIYKVGDSIY